MKICSKTISLEEVMHDQQSRGCHRIQWPDRASDLQESDERGYTSSGSILRIPAKATTRIGSVM